MKFNMDICKVLPLRRKSTLQECRLGASRQFCSLGTSGGLGRQQAEREPTVCPYTAASRAIFPGAQPVDQGE